MDAALVADLWEANAQAWTLQARLGIDVFRDVLNTPAFMALLPPVRGLCGLDVGCGEGSNTRQLAQLGAKMSAIDVAPTFVRHAQRAEEHDRLGIHYVTGDGMALPFQADSFDFVTAFMSLMDIANPAIALLEAARVLRPGGFLQFSILHPCFVPPHRKVIRDRSGRARAIEIGGYYESTNDRIDRWWFSSLSRAQREKFAPFRTPIFHRTLSDWFTIICEAGFVVQRVNEPTVENLGRATMPRIIADTRVAPLSLHIRAAKPVVG